MIKWCIIRYMLKEIWKRSQSTLGELAFWGICCGIVVVACFIVEYYKAYWIAYVLGAGFGIALIVGLFWSTISDLVQLYKDAKRACQQDEPCNLPYDLSYSYDPVLGISGNTYDLPEGFLEEEEG